MTKRVSACPTCGTANPGGTKFCTSCGAKMVVPPPLRVNKGQPDEKGQPEESTKRSDLVWAIPLGVFLIVGLAVAGYLIGGNSPSQESTTDQQLERVDGSLFSAAVPNGWTRQRLDGRESNRLVSEWSDPDSSGTSVLIDTQTLFASGPIMDSARQARSELQQSSGYSEISFQQITLSGRPTAEWIFDLPENRRVDFLTSQCGIGVTVQGVASPDEFEEVLPIFREIASSVTINCEPLTTETPISTQGIGPVLIGMTEYEAAFAGRFQLDSMGGPGGECTYLYSDDLEEVSFMFNEGTLARVDAGNAYSETSSGVGVGDTEAEVYEAYGNQVEEEPNFYDPENSSYLTVIPQDSSENTRVLFDTRDGIVVNIRVGRLPEIEYVEGCA